MTRTTTTKEHLQHLAKFANCSNETERIIEKIQYFTSLGVSEYFHRYDIKQHGKSIKKVKELFESKGFIVEEEKSGIKSKAVLHFSWTNATEGIAYTFACASRLVFKTNEIVDEILKMAEVAAVHGEFSCQYDFNKIQASPDLQESVCKTITRTTHIDDIKIVDGMLIIKWRV